MNLNKLEGGDRSKEDRLCLQGASPCHQLHRDGFVWLGWSLGGKTHETHSSVLLVAITRSYAPRQRLRPSGRASALGTRL